jgi:hypothetical protein
MALLSRNWAQLSLAASKLFFLHKSLGLFCERDLRDVLIADHVEIRLSSCSSSLGLFCERDLRDGLIADHVGIRLSSCSSSLG